MLRVVISDGDTPDWVRLDLKNAFMPGRKGAKPEFTLDAQFVRALLHSAISPDARKWDMLRKCYFIHESVIDAFVKGVRHLVNVGSAYVIVEDERVIVESFEEFFEAPPPVGPKPKSKQELIKQLETLLKSNEIFVSVREDIDIDSAKKIYRKAALVFHPDRNNGDGSRMSELNVIWAELQTKL